MYAIKATGLRRSYGDNEVLKGVDLNVERGTVFSLLGANGAARPPPSRSSPR